jgi:hypothetical protein
MDTLTTFQHLADELVSDISGAQAGLLFRETVLAARQFCDDSGVWAKELDTITLIADTTSYSLDVSALSAKVKFIEKVEVDEVEQALENYGYNRRTGKIELEWTPAGDEEMVVTVVLTPLRTATSIEAHIIEDYGDAIVARAKATLYAQPNRPWTDGAEAQYWQSQYQTKLEDAKRDKIIEGKTGYITLDVPFIL